MQRQIYFCDSWFRGKKIAVDVWPADRALSAHNNKEAYTVLVDSIEVPYCFIEVTEKYVGVGFLDELLRETLSYQYQEVETGKLFLTMATHREYVDKTDKVKSGTTYLFDTTGVVDIRREAFVPEHIVETAKSEFDPSPNYADFPRFGEYDDLIRIERN